MKVYASNIQTRFNTNPMRYLPISHQSRGFPWSVIRIVTEQSTIWL